MNTQEELKQLKESERRYYTMQEEIEPGWEFQQIQKELQKLKKEESNEHTR